MDRGTWWATIHGVANEKDGLIYTLILLRGEFPLGWKGVYSCQAGFTKETDLVHWEQEMT